MDFYYRSLHDGRCEVVCTRCSRTIGATASTQGIRDLENAHACELRKAHVSFSLEPMAPPRLAQHDVDGQNLWRAALLISAVSLIFYGLPTLFEFTALHSLSPWLATVLPGDLTGCVFLAVYFRKVKLGVALYFALSSLEACCYSFGWLSPNTIPWITDLIPTFLIAIMLMRTPPPRRPIQVSFI